MNPSLFGPEAWAPLAQAYRAFFEGDERAEILVHTDDGGTEVLPVSIFFRSDRNLRDADREAVGRARGRVLDAGAGVGSVALSLQSLGLRVTALDVIPEAVEIMKERGVAEPRVGCLEEESSENGYDTVLLLMNGTALAGTLGRLGTFLRALHGLVRPSGQVLVDSTDLRPLQRPSAWPDTEASEEYPGNLQYQLEFRETKGAPFPQLFVDPWTLEASARAVGWKSDVVWRNPEGEFLARLVRSDPGIP